MMSAVRIQSETEIPQGWRYVVEVSRGEHPATVHRVRLGWVDHNHWSGERPLSPSRVVQALCECLLDANPPVDLPERFDASTARRWLDSLDSDIASRL